MATLDIFLDKFNKWKYPFIYVFWLALTYRVNVFFQKYFIMIQSCTVDLKRLRIYDMNKVTLHSMHFDPYAEYHYFGVFAF